MDGEVREAIMEAIAFGVLAGIVMAVLLLWLDRNRPTEDE